jgi:hypothetical protein
MGARIYQMVYERLCCGLVNREIDIRFPAGARDFSLHHVQTGYGAAPGAISSRVKSPVLGVEPSPPPNAESETMWSYTITPPLEGLSPRRGERA